jgi:hypothetical protein
VGYFALSNPTPNDIVRVVADATGISRRDLAFVGKTSDGGSGEGAEITLTFETDVTGTWSSTVGVHFIVLEGGNDRPNAVIYEYSTGAFAGDWDISGVDPENLDRPRLSTLGAVVVLTRPAPVCAVATTTAPTTARSTVYVTLAFPGANFFSVLGGSKTAAASAFARVVFDRLTSSRSGVLRADGIVSIDLAPGSIVATVGCKTDDDAAALQSFANAQDLCVKYQNAVYCTQTGVHDSDETGPGQPTGEPINGETGEDGGETDGRNDATSGGSSIMSMGVVAGIVILCVLIAFVVVYLARGVSKRRQAANTAALSIAGSSDAGSSIFVQSAYGSSSDASTLPPRMPDSYMRMMMPQGAESDVYKTASTATLRSLMQKAAQGDSTPSYVPVDGYDRAMLEASENDYDRAIAERYDRAIAGDAYERAISEDGLDRKSEVVQNAYERASAAASLYETAMKEDGLEVEDYDPATLEGLYGQIQSVGVAGEERSSGTTAIPSIPPPTLPPSGLRRSSLTSQAASHALSQGALYDAETPAPPPPPPLLPRRSEPELLVDSLDSDLQELENSNESDGEAAPVRQRKPKMQRRTSMGFGIGAKS